MDDNTAVKFTNRNYYIKRIIEFWEELDGEAYTEERMVEDIKELAQEKGVSFDNALNFVYMRLFKEVNRKRSEEDDKVLDIRNNPRYEKMRNNSLKSEKNKGVQNNRHKKLVQIKKRIAITSATVGLALGLFIGTTVMPAISNSLQSYDNPSYSTGAEVVREETHRTSDNQNFWFDNVSIASTYTEDMDFDSFIFGVFNSMNGSGCGTDQAMKNMNIVLRTLNHKGYTEYTDFREYCASKGFCYLDEDGNYELNDNGEIKINLDEYSSQTKKYMRTRNELADLESEVESFQKGY